MPATAGRVRMPANNRVHSSAALQTHGIWQSAIGYDPYAPNKEDKKDRSAAQKSSIPEESEPEQENAYASFQGLLALARITGGSNADEVRGACKKCGRVGHLTFQCRNFLSAKDDGDGGDREGKDPVLAGLEKLKGERVSLKGKGVVESSEDEEESESSDSDYDSELERAIAEKYGKRVSGGKSLSSKSRRKGNDGDDDSDDENGRERRKKERRRSKKRRSTKRESSESEDEDEDEGRRKRRKERRRRKDDSSSDEERRRRRRKETHRRKDDSSSDEESRRKKRKEKRRSRKARSDSDVSSPDDDSRVGRERKRSKKSSRKHRHQED